VPPNTKNTFSKAEAQRRLKEALFGAFRTPPKLTVAKADKPKTKNRLPPKQSKPT
jgi:hypothetical protein